jgi:hypothetical protein
VDALVAAGSGVHFELTHGRPMREWFVPEWASGELVGPRRGSIILCRRGGEVDAKIPRETPSQRKVRGITLRLSGSVLGASGSTAQALELTALEKVPNIMPGQMLVVAHLGQQKVLRFIWTQSKSGLCRLKATFSGG